MQVPLFHLCRTKLSHSVGGTPVYYDRRGEERKGKGFCFQFRFPAGGEEEEEKAVGGGGKADCTTQTEKQQLIIPTSKELHSLVVPDVF